MVDNSQADYIVPHVQVEWGQGSDFVTPGSKTEVV